MSQNMIKFQGVFTALVTPFKNGKVDAAAFQALIERQIAAGVAGIVPVGTTGESPTVDHDEHERLFELAVEAANGRVPVIAGCGSNDTQTAIRHMLYARKVGADAALIVAPYYNKPSQAGLIAHFNALADSVDLPIVVYNIPGRTNVDIQPATMAEIARHPNVVALKDSAGDPSRTALHKALIEKDFSILAGDDNLSLGFAAYGATGVVSVLSNLMPEACVALQGHLAQGDFAAARALNQKLDALQRTLFLDPNPVPVKWAMSQLGLCLPDVRLPLVEASHSTKEAVKAAMLSTGIPASAFVVQGRHHGN
jgi:4-hydroxy-tetrahydrodipicolinate synthase